MPMAAGNGKAGIGGPHGGDIGVASARSSWIQRPRTHWWSMFARAECWCSCRPSRHLTLKDTLLPDLELEAGRPLRGSREFRFDENGQRATAALLTHSLKVTGTSWRILGRTDGGDITAVEKPVGRGKLIYIGSYTTDPDLFLWLAR